MRSCAEEFTRSDGTPRSRQEARLASERQLNENENSMKPPKMFPSRNDQLRVYEMQRKKLNLN